MSVQCVVPFPPSTNTYYRHIVVSGRPRTLLSVKGRIYKSLVQAAFIDCSTFGGDVAVMITLFPPDNRRRDLDNHAGKAIYDALEAAGVYHDDSQVKLSIHRMEKPDKANPRAIIEIKALDTGKMGVKAGDMQQGQGGGT